MPPPGRLNSSSSPACRAPAAGRNRPETLIRKDEVEQTEKETTWLPSRTRQLSLLAACCATAVRQHSLNGWMNQSEKGHQIAASRPRKSSASCTCCCNIIRWGPAVLRHRSFAAGELARPHRKWAGVDAVSSGLRSQNTRSRMLAHAAGTRVSGRQPLLASLAARDAYLDRQRRRCHAC